MAKPDDTNKGVFGRARLPVADRYVRPRSRNRAIVFAAVGSALLAVLLLGDFVFRGGRWVSNGPLISGHASFEANCAACHVAFAAVSDDKCQACHERAGRPLGVHELAAHLVYRSGDDTRRDAEAEPLRCATCHEEHRGREVRLTALADTRCAGCHEFSGLGRGHPEFDLVASGTDESNLEFAHAPHLHRARETLGIDDLEQACMTCHAVLPDGSGFAPIDFDASCAGCHLGTRTRTAMLAVAGIAGDDGDGAPPPGVETLDMIRGGQRPGFDWVRRASQADFRQLGARVSKTRLEHRDPWVLHNLRRIRQEVYPSAGLADLLDAAPRPGDDDPGRSYAEALATLEAWADGLRARPEPWIRDELARIETEITLARARLVSGAPALPDRAFDLPLAPDPSVPAARLAELDELAVSLTESCTMCHRLEAFALASVELRDKALARAEFDHRPHAIQASCLECHSAIPVEELLVTPTVVDAERDHAAIVNLPGIARCQECHTGSAAPDACVTCHVFHPDKGYRVPPEIAAAVARGATTGQEDP